MSTNVTAIMLTLDEAENIELSLDSAKQAFDELSMLDGGSTDGTVSVAEQWCEENGKDFVLTESTERELLLEGFGTQRRRAENAGSNDYTLALDSDTVIDIKNPEWFQKDFQLDGYVHTRHRVDGDVESDYRLYNSNNIPGARWRGLVHEEIRTKDGTHLTDATTVAEAPMIHYENRQAAMETKTSSGMYQHRHDPSVGGNMTEKLNKQHYLLKRAIDSKQQSKYLGSVWKKYYANNKSTVADGWEEIHDEYNLPYFTKREGHEIKENELYGMQHWISEEYINGKPVMGAETDSWFTYTTKKIADALGKSEKVY